MRRRGVSYRDLELQGLKLPVIDAQVRFRQAARFDDLLSVRCWVREVASRRVSFGYAVERCDDGLLLATAQTSLVAVDSNYVLTTIPSDVRAKLVPVPDPVRL